jgi:membrane-associated phospholipid phosphatase
MDGVAASVISAGLITPTLKKVVGRARPHTAQGAFDFSPFKNQHSFPSGHTTQAFAVATVIAEHYDEAWVKWLSYGTATAVGYSRIHQDRHFLSDVLAGALIGHLVGKTVVRRHDRLTDDEVWSWTPVATDAMTGLVVSRDF